MKKFFMNLFTTKCPRCVGRVKYIGDDIIGSTWISIYECDKCKNKFV